MTEHATHLIVGPPRHGVVSFALTLADSLQAPVVRVEDWTELDAVLARVEPRTGLHLNFTDRLFGSTPGDAADRVVNLVRRADAPVTATLHDVPQPADGGNHLQRADSYRAVCAAMHGSATNSEHERALLRDIGITDVVVVPLPLSLNHLPVRRPDPEGLSVAVLGFVYPGKGHAEVLAAMAGLPPQVTFRAIGECSTGHDDLAAELAAAAAESGRTFELTGYVPAEGLTAVLHRVSVPVAHHRHISASGSLNSWIAAGRRPLAPENRYTLEHEHRHPGTLRLYPDTHRGLTGAIDTALGDPGSTWLHAGTRSGATPAETARLYALALGRWHG